MDLKDFIEISLNGIENAKNDTASFHGVRGVIDFDVAVVASEEGGAKAGVKVMGIGGSFGGKLGNQTTSRIKFSVQTKGAIAPGER